VPVRTSLLQVLVLFVANGVCSPSQNLLIIENVLALTGPAFKEVDLVLMRHTQRILLHPFHIEMIKDVPPNNGRFGLRYDFPTPHFAVPFRRPIDCNLDTLLRRCVGEFLWVGERET
jgi:hypothetical protein